MAKIGFWFLCAAFPVHVLADISVIDYGAIANDSIDDAAAFKLAQADADQVIIVPAGTYRLEDLTPPISLADTEEWQCAEGAILFVPSTADVVSSTTVQGATYSPVFGEGDTGTGEGDNTSVISTGWSMSGCKLVIEKANVTPIMIAGTGSVSVSIDDITIDGKGSQSNNKALYGILVDDSNGLSVTNSLIEYTQLDGINSRIPDDPVVTGNELNYIGVDAEYPFDSPGDAVENTDFWNAAGISFPGSDRAIISNNAMNRVGGVCIILRGGASSVADNTIFRNALYNCGKGAIGVGINTDGTGSSTNNKIVQNDIRGCDQRYDDVCINVNHRGPSGNITGLQVIGNIIDMFGPGDTASSYPQYTASSNDGYGVYIAKSDSGSVSGIQIRGNRFLNLFGPGVAAELLDSSLVEDNSFENVSRRKQGGNNDPSGWIYPVEINAGDSTTVKCNSFSREILPDIDFTGTSSTVYIDYTNSGHITGTGPTVNGAVNNCPDRDRPFLWR